MKTQEITVGQALNFIDVAVSTFRTGGDTSMWNETLIEDIAFSVNADVQIRDYLLGFLGTDISVEDSIKFLAAIIPLVEESQRVPFLTILSALEFENDGAGDAFLSLTLARTIDPSYSLAHLLDRVYRSGLWTPDSMTRMRSDCHYAVTAKLKSESTRIVGEETE